MQIKGLSKERLEKRLDHLRKTNPKSRWIKYIQFHIKKLSGGT